MRVCRDRSRCFRFLACTRHFFLMLRSSVERRRFSVEYNLWIFFFHFITFVRIRSRESFFAFLNQIRRKGSRPTSGSCEIIKIFMAFFIFFFGRKNHFKVLPWWCSTTECCCWKNEKLNYNGCLVKRELCVFFNDLLKREDRTLLRSLPDARFDVKRSSFC